MKPNSLVHVVRMVILVAASALFLASCSKPLTDSEYLQRAKDFRDKGDLKAAVIELKNALISNPENIEARWLLGEVYLDTGLWAAAEKEIRRAQSLGIDQRAVPIPLSRALLKQGKFQDVLDLADRLSEPVHGKEAAKLLSMRGHAYLGLSKPEDARKSYEMAKNIDTDDPESSLGLALLALKEQDDKAAKEWLNKALAVDPKFVDAWDLSGDLARREGDAKKAESDYSKAIDLREMALAPRLKRALIRIFAGKYQEASNDIRFLVERIGPTPGTEYARGLIEFQQGNYSEAQTAFESALSKSSNYMPAVFYLGVIHYMQGNLSQAHLYLGSYADKYPNNVRAQLLMAALELRENDLDHARRRLDRVLQARPDDVEATKLMTEFAVRSGDTNKAIEYMQKMVTQEPDIASSHLRLGLGLLVEGEGESGALELEKAATLSSNSKLIEFVMALNEMRKGTPEEAIKIAKAFTVKQPDNPMSWNLLGLTQVKLNRIDEARHSFEQSLKLVPGESAAAKNLASLALRNGDIAEAIRMYESVLEHRPDDMYALTQLVKLKQGQGHLTEVQGLLENKVKDYPDELEPRALLADVYSKQGDLHRAVTLMLEVDDEYSKNPAYLGMLGNLQMKSGDYANAASTIEKMVERVPRSALANQKLCEVYDKAGSLDKLEHQLERTLALDPNHLPTRLIKLKLLIQTHKLEEAALLLKELQTKYPEHPGLFVLQARLALAHDRPADAISAYREALKRVPNTELVGQLALAQWQAGQQDAAIQTMKDWLAEHPDDLVVQYNLANLYLAGNMHEEARAAFAKVIEKHPDHPVALINLAALTRQKDPSKALDYAERAYKVAPDAPVVEDVLAQILLDRGEVNRATLLLERAVKKAPDNMKIRLHWAHALADNGQLTEAKEELTRMLNEGKSFAGEEEARELLEQLSKESG